MNIFNNDNLKSKIETTINSSKELANQVKINPTSNFNKVIFGIVIILSLSFVTVSANTFGNVGTVINSSFGTSSVIPEPRIEYANTNNLANSVENLTVIIEPIVNLVSSSSSSESSSVQSSSISSILSSSSSSSQSEIKISSAPIIISSSSKSLLPKIEPKPEPKIEAAVILSSSSSSVTPEKTEPTPIEETLILTPEVPQASEPEPTKPKTNYELIQYYCGLYGCNADRLNRVMICESGGRSNAYGPGGYIGLFQFAPASFKNYSRLSGIPTNDIYNAEQQIQLAAWMYSNGYAGSWPNC